MSEAEIPLSQTPRHDRRGAFFLLFLALAVVGIGNTMLFSAVLPPLVVELELPYWTLGAIASLSALLWVVMSPFWGGKSNEWGRKRVIVFGLMGYALSMLLIGIFASLAVLQIITAPVVIVLSLVFSRALFGLIGSGTSPAAQAYVADRTTPDERQEEIAFLTSGFSLGTIVGPAFAAAIAAALGLLSPIFLAAILSASVALLIWLKLPEQTPPKQEGKPRPRILNPMWLDRRILPYVLFAMALSISVGIVFQSYGFAMMDKMNVRDTQVVNYLGPAYSMGAAATMLAQLVIIPRAHLSNRSLMVWGAVIFSVGVLLIIPTDQYAVLIMAQFFVGIGNGLCRPGYFAGASLAVSNDEQGDVAGVIMGANAIGFVFSPVLGPAMYEYVGVDVPFYLAGAISLGMGVFAWFAVKEHKDDESQVRKDTGSQV